MKLTLQSSAREKLDFFFFPLDGEPELFISSMWISPAPGFTVLT